LSAAWQEITKGEGAIMVDKNIADTVQNAAASASDAANTAQEFINKGFDNAREYATKGYGSARDYANKSYDAARDYANTGIEVAGRVGDNVGEFVRKEPWIAIAAAFAVGYVAARIMRRLSI
jgi:ElaB/YqjD/DUF883 family membrane-anchored ribosome-binding protein